MPFKKIEAEKLASAVVRQVENLILRGILRPGDRLPAERELAERLGVSRPSLREAIAELSERGLLEARAGAGIYVADILGGVFSPALVRLFQNHDDALLDHIAFRRDMEGLAASRAARQGSETDLRVVSEIFAKMETAHARRDAAEEARLDADFHMAIVEASHNVVMLHLMRAMMDLLREGVVYNRAVMFRQRTTRDTLLDQHREIERALRLRDPEGAQAAVEGHLDFVRRCLIDQREADRHEETAQLRLQQEGAR
ncbi:FCD domain-containing protein [Jannaschia aquimarina]|uniref:Pyruvate dehydrogenase complex repressor n=1 Tax=Jannaschia aquimarina TaxID=935700 RepID=A0A0D1EFD8_9RHOB|nr:FCD domain-containing protein [Jannaschia aquimarina]KIT15611.1 Pyruvate dehydrogenase complex repressor [Jannaschia aquimarina]SNT27697.1 transcriptional regulator, GntR family [Jannaschia aquimarina]